MHPRTLTAVALVAALLIPASAVLAERKAKPAPVFIPNIEVEMPNVKVRMPRVSTHTHQRLHRLGLARNNRLLWPINRRNRKITCIRLDDSRHQSFIRKEHRHGARTLW